MDTEEHQLEVVENDEVRQTQKNQRKKVKNGEVRVDMEEHQSEEVGNDEVRYSEKERQEW